VEATLDEKPIDFGIELRVVEQDLEGGVAVIPGTPPVRVLRTHRFGGLVDGRRHRITHSYRHHPERYLAAGGNPLVWYCSAGQERLLVRTPNSPDKVLAYGAFGSGKTRVLSMLAVLLALALCEDGYAGKRKLYGGATAPTQERRDIILAGLGEVCRPEWYRHEKKHSNWHLTAIGVTIQVRAAKAQSAETGNPIQGQNWCFAVADELQDQTDAFPHILARGRSAPGGRYYFGATATAKDSMNWREFRDGLGADWLIERLTGPSNAFVWASFWEDMRRNLSPRDFKRMVEAMDVGPERALYPTWDRDYNLRPIPQLGADDVTARILGNTGPNFAMLLGHDPGTLRNVTTMSRAYQPRKAVRHDWYVVDEFTTNQTTTEQHAEGLRDYLRSKYDIQHQGSDEPRVLVRCDPWTKRDTGTHKSVHDQFAALGFTVLSAAYNDKGEGRGQVPLHASVEMLCRLFRSAAGVGHLFIAANEHGKPMAPDTMRAIELSEWDPWGQRETARKDDKRKDPTDHTSTLRYKFWPYERFRKVMTGKRGMAVG
jgi:hypothetical protein